ncbi:MAG: DUF1524 domain-containing protein [Gammaproteobacteria bacterium]|nr:DUF1524 domain-containing protein [Gammaproteobacteria bacterium]
MKNSKTLISLSTIIPLILPILSGLANPIPEIMSPSIGGVSTGVDHENVIIEFEKSIPPNSHGTELYSSPYLTRKSHLSFPRINPFLHQSNHSTHISTSQRGKSLLSAKELWTRTQSQSGNICEDINTANASVLQRVRGIGRVKAQAIIAYRNQHGPFRSLDELTNVKGVGPATVENFRMAGFCVQGVTSTTEIQSSQSSSEENNSDTTVNNCSNVNTASTTELQRVSRIGAVRAQAIIDYRNQHGPFQSLNELTRVRGIGAAIIENFRRAGFCVKASTEASNFPAAPSQISSNNSTATNSNCYNINTANPTTLQRVSGIGPAKAQAIKDYRNQHGPFRLLDELTHVRGIGPATLENFRRAGFCVSTPTSASGSADSQSNAQLDDLDPTDNICEDINTASVATFQRVSGIGPVKAQAITDYRNQHGPFRSLDELTRVRGIGPVTLENFRRAGFCAPTSTSTDSAILFSNPPNIPPLRTSPLTYHRNLYGGWLDTDSDCQNTRQEILIAESRVKASLDETGCIVIAGEWYDPYLDSLITDPSVIDIDHFIPLAEVHRSGGAKWDDSTRYSFGNDLSENGALIPVSASANRSKGDRDPANWLPPNTTYHCQYVDRWVALKETWRLTMDYAERQAIMNILDGCGSNV